MALRLTEKSDIRIFILYILASLDTPIDFVTLHDISVQDEFVKPFDFMEEFYELRKIKALEIRENEKGEELVYITRKGKEVAEAMKDNILPEILDHALRSALQLISFKTKGLTAGSSLEEKAGGKYELTCTVKGEDGIKLQTVLVLDSRREAERMKINYDEKSEFIYRGIISLLSGNMNYLAEGWSEDFIASYEEEKSKI